MSEKQRILLVDDYPNISHLVRLYLEKEGFAVTEAARGDDALVKVTEGHKTIVGHSLVYQKKVGEGRIIVLGTVPSEADMQRLIAEICPSAGVAIPDVEGEVMVAPREGEAGKGLILVEYGAKPAAVTLPCPMTDLLTGERLSGTIAIEPYGVRVLKAE